MPTPSLPHPPPPAAQEAQKTEEAGHPRRSQSSGSSWKLWGALIATGMALSFAGGVVVHRQWREAATASRQPTPPPPPATATASPSPPMEEPAAAEKKDDASPLPSPPSLPSLPSPAPSADSFPAMATPWPAAVTALRVRLAFMEGRPFVRDLALLMAVTAGSPRLHQAALALRPWTGGVMAGRALRESFRDALDALRLYEEGDAQTAQGVPAANGAQRGDDESEGGLSYLRGLIRITKVAPTPQGDSGERQGQQPAGGVGALARAARAIEEDAVAEAVRHLSALPEVRREHFAAWLRQAQNRLAAERALVAFEAALLDALSAAAP